MGIELLRDRTALEGILRVWDRPAGGRIWRSAGEWHNIVLNQFYIDLFVAMSSGAWIGNIGAMALGVKASPAFVRTDTGLTKEWLNPVATLTTQITSGATGVVALAVTGGVRGAIASGTQLQLGAGQTVVTSGAVADGATSIPVTSFTATSTYTVGTAVNVLDWTPQRMGVTLTTPNVADPPSNVWSFYLAAAANVANVVFTEAGLMYTTPSLVAGGAGKFATHVAFAYTKNVNTDTRFDYTLQRALT
jgi:hypothetical protein